MNTKKWYKSMTLRGAFVALIGMGITFLGREIPISEIENIVGITFELIGAAITIYGRFKAEEKVVM